MGINIIKASAPTLKKTTMELGGKSANIVLADADLDAAVETAFHGRFYNQDEICTAGSRLIVERPVCDEVLDRLVQTFDRYPMGDPLDWGTSFGPVANKQQHESMLEYIQVGRDEGATVRHGGGAASVGGGGASTSSPPSKRTWTTRCGSPRRRSSGR